jgi:hypothetical protein
MALNFDSFPVSWNFSYAPAVVERPYGQRPNLTENTWTPIIKATIQKLTLGCQADIDEFYQKLFNPVTPLQMMIPFFFRDRIETVYYEDNLTRLAVWSQYEPATGYIRFYDKLTNLTTNVSTLHPTRYFFSSGVYFGTNAPAGTVLNPNNEVNWRVSVRPVKRDFKYYRPSANTAIEIEPIELVVVVA